MSRLQWRPCYSFGRKFFRSKLGWPGPWIVLGFRSSHFVQRRPHLPCTASRLVRLRDFSRASSVAFGRSVSLHPRLGRAAGNRFRATCSHRSTAARSSRALSIVGALRDSETFHLSFWISRHHRVFAWMTGADSGVRGLDHGARGRCAVRCLSVFGAGASCGRAAIWGGVFAVALWETIRATSLFLSISWALDRSWPGSRFCRALWFCSRRSCLNSTGKRAGRCYCFAPYHRRPCPHSI